MRSVRTALHQDHQERLATDTNLGKIISYPYLYLLKYNEMATLLSHLQPNTGQRFQLNLTDYQLSSYAGQHKFSPLRNTGVTVA